MLKNGLTVLSLCDGIAVGRLALEKAGLKVAQYFASEIDKRAIFVAQKNYPDIIQLGDVNNINFEVFAGNIDLLLGGTPCQDLSIAMSNRQGLKGSKSSLFFKFVEALEVVKPKYFLFENVGSMRDADKQIIDKFLGGGSTMINSALVSAMNRKRIYWTNFLVTQPSDRGILLKDIIESGNVDRDKALTITSSYSGFMGTQSYLCRRYFGKRFGQAVFEGDIEKIKEKWKQDPYFNSDEINIRPMTVSECEKCMTLPIDYTQGISTDARYKAIGNAWNAETIAHIFNCLHNEIINKGVIYEN